MNRLLFVGLLWLLAACSETEDFCSGDVPENLPEYNRLCRAIGNLQEFRTDAEECASRYDGTYGGVTFAGSSTFTLWTSLADDFPGFDVRNMGIGGATLRHIVAFGEELIYRNDPEVTVLYIGDNDAYSDDIGSFRRKMDCFVRNYRHRLPESFLVLVSVKPSPARSGKKAFYRAVNDYYRSAASDRVYFTDIWTGMENGDTRSFFMPDCVHLNRRGYEYVAAQLRPLLARLLPAPRNSAHR